MSAGWVRQVNGNTPMHELAIATSLVDVAAEEAGRQGNVVVRVLHVRVGAWSGVAADALRFAFEVAREGTCVEAAQLRIEIVPDSRSLELRALEVIDAGENR